MRVRPSACASRCSAFSRGFSIPRFLKYAVVDCNTPSTVIRWSNLGVRYSFEANEQCNSSSLKWPTLSAARLHLQLATPESIRRGRPPSRGLNYKASNRYDDRLRGSVENCRCESFLRDRRFRSGRGAARYTSPLLRAASVPASAHAGCSALVLCF